MINRRQKFSKEFKEEAVAHWQNTDKTAQEVASNLGIPSKKYLSRWKRELTQKGNDAFPGHGQLLGKDAEIADLKRRLNDAEQERDILKKAVGIFSKI